MKAVKSICALMYRAAMWVKKFVWSSLAEKGAISSKRCMCFTAMLTITFLAIHGHLTNTIVNPHVFDALVLIALTSAGISAYEKTRNLSKVPTAPVAGEAQTEQA